VKDSSTKRLGLPTKGISPWGVLAVVLIGWVLVLTGLFFVLFAIASIAYILSGAVLLRGFEGASLAEVALFAGLGIPILLFGIWLAGLRTKMTCSTSSGYITVTRGLFPIYLPSLRTKHISREEARTAFVDGETRSRDSLSGESSWYTVYVIKVRLLSRKTLTIADAGRKRQRADDLVRRIRELAGSQKLDEVGEIRAKSRLKLSMLEEEVDFSKEKLLGIVSVTELRGEEVVERNLRFYSSGILSPDPIPYADISTIRVYKALGFIPRIEICTNFGSKKRFTLSLMGRVGGLRDRHRALLKCCSVVNSACPDKLKTKSKYLNDALTLRPDKRKYGEKLTRIPDLESLKGETASNPDSRLALFRSALHALIEVGGGSFVIFECKERPECYVQFALVPDTSNLIGEVSGEPVSEKERGILISRGFEAPDMSNPNYSRDFESPQPRTLAELVENAFRDVLNCPDSYTAHIVEAVYQK